LFGHDLSLKPDFKQWLEEATPEFELFVGCTMKLTPAFA